VLIDLDHFKVINDVHGHAEGDRVLAEIAGRLADGLRAADTVFRAGGDEFAVLLTNTGEEAGTDVARRAAADAVRGDAATGRVTVTVGVASPHASEPDSLRELAGARLREAKQGG
jgi:diguanylate cyclase (GGDEF)-like protein